MGKKKGSKRKEMGWDEKRLKEKQTTGKEGMREKENKNEIGRSKMERIRKRERKGRGD